MQATNQSLGFGDTVAKLTKLFGVDPCGGCENRREILNRWIPYKNRESRPQPVKTAESNQPDSIETSPSSINRSNQGKENTWPGIERRSSNLILPDTNIIREIEASSTLQREIFGAHARGDSFEIAASSGWRAPGRRRGPLDVEGDRRERRTDRRSDRSDRRQSRSRRGSSSTSPGLGKTKPTSFACGLDVTLNTKAAVQSAKTSFRGWTNDQKHSACESLHSLRTGSYAWDIVELHSQVKKDTINNGFRPGCATSGATPACGSSVTVDGSCHFAGSANYVIFGVMCRLCSDHYRKMLSDASWYELIDKDTYQDGILQFSQHGMLSLIDLYKKYIPLLSLDSPAANIEAAKRWSIAGYGGWPTGTATPTPDRANCTLTCGTTTSIASFLVSWYPHLNPYRR